MPLKLKDYIKMILLLFYLLEDTLDSPRCNHILRDPHNDLHPVLAHQDIDRSLYRLHQCNLLHLKARPHRTLGMDLHRGHKQYHQSILNLKPRSKSCFKNQQNIRRIICNKTRFLLFVIFYLTVLEDFIRLKINRQPKLI